jgi:hypothetical protein
VSGGATGLLPNLGPASDGAANHAFAVVTAAFAAQAALAAALAAGATGPAAVR